MGVRLRQFRCDIQPPDQDGIVTAGYGGMINCGNNYESSIVPLLTEPIPRSNVNLSEYG